MCCGMVGDNLAAAAITNDWAGIIVYGCIRDAAPIAAMPLCVKALNTHPGVRRLPDLAWGPDSGGGSLICACVVVPTQLRCLVRCLPPARSQKHQGVAGGRGCPHPSGWGDCVSRRLGVR